MSVSLHFPRDRTWWHRELHRSERRWCHYSAATILCNQHLLHNEWGKKKNLSAAKSNINAACFKRWMSVGYCEGRLVESRQQHRTADYHCRVSNKMTIKFIKAIYNFSLFIQFRYIPSLSLWSQHFHHFHCLSYRLPLSSHEERQLSVVIDEWWKLDGEIDETWLCFHHGTAILIKSVLNESNHLITCHSIFHVTCTWALATLETQQRCCHIDVKWKY